MTRGEEEKALDEAIFSAKIGALGGPVKTPFGYYVYNVQKVLPSNQQTLAQSEASIASQLGTQGSQKALTKFVEEFRKKWMGRTECRTGYVVPDCKESKTSTSTSSTATG